MSQFKKRRGKIVRFAYRHKRMIMNELFVWKKVEFTCNACGHRVRFPADSMLFQSPLFQKDRVIGGGFRPGEQCPICFSSDRLRFVLEVLRTRTDIFTAPCAVLEFAPIRIFQTNLEKNPNLTYLSGDIVPGRAMRTLDITDIALPDNAYDYVIANHVLEHVNESSTIREMMRVAKNGGILLLTMPIDISQAATLEDPSVTTAEDRLRVYGQEDHIRLYGLDAADRLRSYGLDVQEVIADDSWTAKCRKYRFIPNDRVFLCTVRK